MVKAKYPPSEQNWNLKLGNAEINVIYESTISLIHEK